MTELSTEDISILVQQNKETLALWYCALNSWNWPKDLPNPIRNDHANPYVPGNRRSRLMDWIYVHIGQKLISRTWNYDMSEETFDEWWSVSFGYEGPPEEREKRQTAFYKKRTPDCIKRSEQPWIKIIIPKPAKFGETNPRQLDIGEN